MKVAAFVLAAAFLAVYEEVDRALDRRGLMLRAKRLECAAARIRATIAAWKVESEIRIVSPIPSASSVPRPTADLSDPDHLVPASVTPRCSGCPGASSQARTGAPIPAARSASASSRVHAPSQVAPAWRAARPAWWCRWVGRTTSTTSSPGAPRAPW